MMGVGQSKLNEVWECFFVSRVLAPFTQGLFQH